MKESLQYIQEAQNLAKENGFEEIKELCTPRKNNIDKKLPKVESDEKKSDEMIVDEIRGVLYKLDK